MQFTNNPVDNTCKNGCIYATKMPTMEKFKYTGETADQQFLWRCTKIDQIVTIDSIFHKLGCASFDNTKQNAAEAQAEKLLQDVNDKLDEVIAAIPSETNRMVAVGGEYVGTSPVTETQKAEADNIVEHLKPSVPPAPVTMPLQGSPEPIKEVVTEGIPVHQIEVKEAPPVAKPAELPKKRTRRTKAEMEAARAMEVDNSPPSTTHAEIETPVEPVLSPAVKDQV